ncbi:hypothetical protein JCM15548_11885 [Geofilum rubicundum JCM 15548]|uniref:Uncharacterized protein n=1 Tax=Geofilum rubicundum JCM 15548 TaxID=1236989 RepID=A0A0E9LXR8_9BACT|nr:hypothetical protein JCM15548_11885 [Geofilum rubicundum JCM 15548]
MAALVLVSAGAIAQEPEQTRTREALQAQERVHDGVPAEDALQKREQKRLERTERKNARKEEALQKRSRGLERSEAARTRSQSMRQENARMENRKNARPERSGESAGNAQRARTENRSKGGK